MRLWLAVPALLLGASAANAADVVRTASIKDGVDRTVLYDVAAITARLDRGAGRLTVTVRLHRPFPTSVEQTVDGISIQAAGRPGLVDCRLGGKTVTGRTSLNIRPARRQPGPYAPEIHVARVDVAYRSAPAILPIAFSADRLTATVVVEDNLLKSADLRCLSAHTTGRAIRDPSLPGGGRTDDDIKGVYFAGFSPAARRNKALARCNRFKGSRRARCRRSVRARIFTP